MVSEQVFSGLPIEILWRIRRHPVEPTHRIPDCFVTFTRTAAMHPRSYFDRIHPLLPRLNIETDVDIPGSHPPCHACISLCLFKCQNNGLISFIDARIWD